MDVKQFEICSYSSKIYDPQLQVIQRWLEKNEQAKIMPLMKRRFQTCDKLLNGVRKFLAATLCNSYPKVQKRQICDHWL